MDIIENFVKREATAEELAEMKAEATKAKLMERSRPLTEQEVSRMLLREQVNTLAVDDNTALRMMEFYPTFEEAVGQTVNKGFKFTHGGRLWSVVQPSLTIEAHYPPGEGTESLYAEVCESHDGTEDDPIPYGGNMALQNGLYYTQDYEVYRCTRDTGNAVYHALRDLVGIYVEVVT